MRRTMVPFVVTHSTDVPGIVLFDHRLGHDHFLHSSHYSRGRREVRYYATNFLQLVVTATQGVEEPTVLVTMTANDFFRVYSGAVGAFEMTRMIMGRKILVHNNEFGKVSSFASSFDYSTETWNAFYKQKEAIIEVPMVHPVYSRIGSMQSVFCPSL